MNDQTGTMADPPARRRAMRLALAAWLLSCACTVTALIVHAHVAARADVLPLYPGSVVVATAWPLAGILVLRARPGSPAGWVLVATSALGVYVLMSEYALWDAWVADAALPGAAFAAWVSMFGFAVYFFVLPLLPLTYPDVRAPSRSRRLLIAGVLAVATAATLARMVVPGRSDTDPSIVNPLGVEGLEPLNWVVLIGSYLCIVVATPAAVVALVLRLRRSVGTERAQLQWFVLGGVLLSVAIVVSQLAPSQALADAAFALGLAAPPLGIAIAMLRHGVIDIGLVLDRTLVLLLVVAVVAASGTWVLWQLDPSFTGTRGGALLVAALVLVAVGLRSVLQHWIDRRWFPQRQDAEHLGRAIAATVSTTAEPRAALQELVVAVRRALRLPYVGVSGPVAASDGDRPEMVETIDAVALGRAVATLDVAARRPGEGFTRQERRLLEDVAERAAMIVHAAELVESVEASRAAIVRAREEERRRLRNDLHDGVGPALAGLALRADALTSGLATDPRAREAALVRDGLRETVALVRSVAHGLRPPVLDQLGLEAALRELVEGSPGPLAGRADVGDLGDVPAAVEVALHSIAAEAVTNALRHSAGSHVELRAQRDGTSLSLSVRDNGRGIASSPREGVGLGSMRARAAEVGGRIVHRPAPGGGTIVDVVVPVGEPAAPRSGVTP